MRGGRSPHRPHPFCKERQSDRQAGPQQSCYARTLDTSSRTTSVAQRAWCATRSLTEPRDLRPCRPRLPTTTRSASAAAETRCRALARPAGPRGGSRRSAPPAACRRPCRRGQRRARAPRRSRSERCRRDGVRGRRLGRAIDAGDDPPGEVGAGIARDEHGARSLVDQLCRRRAEEDASETALAVAADGDECVLRTLDLTEQLIPRGAANDPSPGVREPLDVAARFLEIPLRLRALLLFVVVGRDGAGPFRRRARRRCRKRRGAPPDPRPAPTPAWPLPQPRASRRSRRGRWQRRSFHFQRSLPTCPIDPGAFVVTSVCDSSFGTSSAGHAAATSKLRPRPRPRRPQPPACSASSIACAAARESLLASTVTSTSPASSRRRWRT